MAQLQYKQNRIRIAARKELLEQNRLRNGFERRLVRQLQSGFKATGRLARKEYEQLGRLVETSRQSERKLRDVLESHYRAVIDAFGTRVLRNRKQDSQFEILIREYMNTVGSTRITQINNTTMKAINKVISKGAVEGLGVQAIGKNIFDKMDGSFSKLRSQTISRTETHSAASYANDRVNASLGIPNQIKRWVSVADARTRSWHVALNGTEVGKDEPFTVTVKGISYKMDYTGDPKGGAVNTINCRCVTLYLDPDDVIVDQPETIVEPPQPKRFGEVGEDELPFHEMADWNTKSLPYKVIKRTDPIKIKYGVGRAYASTGHLVAMSTKKGFNQLSEDDKFVWRHEFGHIIDQQIGRKIQKSGYGGVRTSYFSTIAAKEILNDRKKYQRKEKDKSRAKTQEETGFEYSVYYTTTTETNYKAFIKANPDEEIYTFRRKPNNIIVGFDKDKTKEKISKILKGSGLDANDIEELYNGSLYSDMQNWSDTKHAFFRIMLIALKNKDASTFFQVQKYVRYQGGLYLADFMEALSNASVGYGHGKSYLNKFSKVEKGLTNGHTTEAFANYTSLLGGEQANVYRKLLTWFAPETTKAFDELFEELDKGALDKFYDI